MRSVIRIALPLLFACSLLGCFDSVSNKEFNAADAWGELESVVRQQYAYLDRADFGVEETFSEFKARAVSAGSEQEFVDIGQMFLRHFNDPHLNLGPYNESDFSVFPTGSDIRVVYKDSKFFVEDVKAESAADKAGIRPGPEVVAINGLSLNESIEAMFGTKFDRLTVDQIGYGANVSLGGYRNKERVVVLKHHGEQKTYQLAASYESINSMASGPTLNFETINGFGYIRFNNSLGDRNTVKAFKEALKALSGTKALIVDLRNTPSGGNTGVAEPILGHFVEVRTAYQLYQTQVNGTSYKDANMETAYAAASEPYYDKPFVVLAGHWTGSMGEGMTIGLDAIGAVAVIGAPMADLLGGIKTVKLAESDAWLEIGFERLYHVNGSYREDFVPQVLLSAADRDINGNDPALTAALKILNDL